MYFVFFDKVNLGSYVLCNILSFSKTLYVQSMVRLGTKRSFYMKSYPKINHKKVHQNGE